MVLLDGVPLYAATVAHARSLIARHGNEPDAPALAAEAERRYRELGWPLHAARCAELLGGVRASRTYRASHAKGELRRTIGLSRREAQVAQLAATGVSNKDVATRLGLNLRTVEKHMTAIFTKLGLRNRAELAALMSRTGSAGSPTS